MNKNVIDMKYESLKYDILKKNEKYDTFVKEQ